MSGLSPSTAQGYVQLYILRRGRLLPRGGVKVHLSLRHCLPPFFQCCYICLATDACASMCTYLHCTYSQPFCLRAKGVKETAPLLPQAVGTARSSVAGATLSHGPGAGVICHLDLHQAQSTCSTLSTMPPSFQVKVREPDAYDGTGDYE